MHHTGTLFEIIKPKLFICSIILDPRFQLIARGNILARCIAGLTKVSTTGHAEVRPIAVNVQAITIITPENLTDCLITRTGTFPEIDAIAGNMISKHGASATAAVCRVRFLNRRTCGCHHRQNHDEDQRKSADSFLRVFLLNLSAKALVLYLADSLYKCYKNSKKVFIWQSCLSGCSWKPHL